MKTINLLKQYNNLLIATLIIVLTISGLTIAQGNNKDPTIHTHVEDIQWQPCDGLEGCEFMILRGNAEMEFGSGAFQDNLRYTQIASTLIWEYGWHDNPARGALVYTAMYIAGHDASVAHFGQSITIWRYVRS